MSGGSYQFIGHEQNFTVHRDKDMCKQVLPSCKINLLSNEVKPYNYRMINSIPAAGLSMTNIYTTTSGMRPLAVRERGSLRVNKTR